MKEVIRRISKEQSMRVEELMKSGLSFESASKIVEMEFNQDQDQDTQQKNLDKYQELIEEQSRLIARQEEQIELMKSMFINHQNKIEELIMQHTSIINSLINR